MTIVKVDEDYEYDTDDILIPNQEDFDRFYEYVLMFWSPYNIPTKEEVTATLKQYIKKCDGVIFELATMEREAVTMMLDERRKRKFRTIAYKARKIIYDTHSFIDGFCEKCGLTNELKIHRLLYSIDEFYTCKEQIIKNIIE